MVRRMLCRFRQPSKRLRYNGRRTESHAAPKDYPSEAADPSRRLPATAGTAAWLLAEPSQRVPAEVTITSANGKRMVSANEMPDHAIGDFPNRHDPVPLRPQDPKLEAPLGPIAADKPASIAMWQFGIAVNGVPFDPNPPSAVRIPRSRRFCLESTARNRGACGSPIRWRSIASPSLSVEKTASTEITCFSASPKHDRAFSSDPYRFLHGPSALWALNCTSRCPV